MNIMNVTYRVFRVAVWVRRALLIAIGALFFGIFNGAALRSPYGRMESILFTPRQTLKLWRTG